MSERSEGDTGRAPDPGGDVPGGAGGSGGGGAAGQVGSADAYPVRFNIEFPDRPLNRLTSFFRIIWIIPIAILLGTIVGMSGGGDYNGGAEYYAIGGAGLLFFPPLLMILFRKKYPRWWFDWNLELARFIDRVVLYLLLMDDRYPSTDEQQSLRLDIDYPDAENDLMRGMPIVKWILAIPHYIILFFLYIAAFFAVIFAWFAILFTGTYPRGLFEFVEGVFRWHMRVMGYMFILITDRYPPFSLSE